MKQETLQLTGGNSNDSRRALDFYPTPRNVTVALLDYLNLPKMTIWDPACGDHAMTKVFNEYGHEAIGTDIVTGDDYLTTHREAGAIITNPPFSLAAEFIEKAVQEAPIVAMLLKSQYWHAAKRYELFKKYPPTHVLPLTWRPDFLEHERTDGKKGSPTMEVAWTVWDFSFPCKGLTIYHPLERPRETKQLTLL